MTARADPEPSRLGSGKPARQLHLPEPDYTRPTLELTSEQRETIVRKLVYLYGKDRAEDCFEELERLMKVYSAHKPVEMIEPTSLSPPPSGSRRKTSSSSPTET